MTLSHGLDSLKRQPPESHVAFKHWGLLPLGVSMAEKAHTF